MCTSAETRDAEERALLVAALRLYGELSVKLGVEMLTSLDTDAPVVPSRGHGGNGDPTTQTPRR